MNHNTTTSKLGRCGWALLALALFSGCAAPPQTSTTVTDEPAAAKGAVERVFGAFAARDCAVLNDLLGSKLRKPLVTKGCVAMLRNEPLSDAKLVSVAQPVRDGRDSSAWMVQVMVHYEGRTSPVNVRVKRTGSRYRVVAM